MKFTLETLDRLAIIITYKVFGNYKKLTIKHIVKSDHKEFETNPFTNIYLNFFSVFRLILSKLIPQKQFELKDYIILK
jgi:hypothetical protein